MPYPMAHLAVAHGLLSSLRKDDPGALYLGSVAPDAYRWLRPEKSVPDRLRAHLSDAGDPLEEIGRRFRGVRAEFEIGYALHLLVDLYWDGAVLRPFLKSHSYPVYARDMRVLDVNLYLEARAEETIFPLLAAAEPRGLDDLVTAEQVKLERDLTLAWYRERVASAGEPLLGPLSLSQLTDAADGAARFAAREWANLAAN